MAQIIGAQSPSQHGTGDAVLRQRIVTGTTTSVRGRRYGAHTPVLAENRRHAGAQCPACAAPGVASADVPALGKAPATCRPPVRSRILTALWADSGRNYRQGA